MTVGLLPRQTLYDKALDYTSYYYETSKHPPDSFGVCSGNFDGAGGSYGCIQFNWFSETIQPIFKDLINNYPTVCLNAFNNVNTDYLTWKTVVQTYSTTNQINWGDTITIWEYEADGVTKKSGSGHKIKEPWNTYFKQLMLTPEAVARQKTAVQPYYDN